jgi:cupin fold WbuC family metalloprotein
MTPAPPYDVRGPGILYTRSALTLFGPADIALVTDEARRSPSRRARICAHQAPEDRQHVMLIAVCSDSFLIPQRHIGRSETLQVLQGRGRLALFSHAGEIQDVVALAAPGEGGAFFCNMPADLFHALVVDSPEMIYVETTVGPFDRATTVDGPWARTDLSPAAQFAALRQSVDAWPRKPRKLGLLVFS